MPVGGGGSSDLQSGGTTTSNLGTFNIVIVPGAALAGNAAALAAFNRAADQWEDYIADPILVTVNANLAPLGVGILGQASSVGLFGSFNTIRNAMVADANDEADDAVATMLPTAAQFSTFLPAGFGLDGNLQMTKANAKALGFANLDINFGVSDAQITFSSNFAFDFDNSNGVSAGQYDFESVAAHEIGHALGFVSDVDYVDFLRSQNQVANDVSPTTLDLFRFDDGAANDPTTLANFTTEPRSMVPGNVEHFDQISDADGGAIEVLFSTGVSQGDGRQASHWKDNLTLGIMDPTLATTEISSINGNDLRVFDLIGYEIVQVPEPGTLALVLIGGLLAMGSRRRWPGYLFDVAPSASRIRWSTRATNSTSESSAICSLVTGSPNVRRIDLGRGKPLPRGSASNAPSSATGTIVAPLRRASRQKPGSI